MRVLIGSRKDFFRFALRLAHSVLSNSGKFRSNNADIALQQLNETFFGYSACVAHG